MASALKRALILETKQPAKANKAELEVNLAKDKSRTQRNNNNSKQSNKQGGKNDFNGKRNNTKSKVNSRICSHCGWRNHTSNACKYAQSRCNSCGNVGHLASVCRSENNKTINYVSDSDESNEIDHFNNFIFYVSPTGPTEVYSLTIKIDGVDVRMTCDTGAPCIMIPISLYNKLKGNKCLNSCSVPYVSYNGDTIKLLGEYNAIVSYQGIKRKLAVVVANSDNPALLGRSFLRANNFELTQVNLVVNEQNYAVIIEQIKSEYSEIFNGRLGKYVNHQISLQISDNAKPVFFKPRTIPLAWKDKVEKQLRELIKQDILEPIDNSDWGTPLVPILKPNGELRICGDYKVTLNKYLVDFRYPLPRIDEIFASLQGCEIFIKLDMSSAYNQLVLDEKSQLLCSWSTHIGTLKVKCLPFGIKVAAPIFQKTMESLFCKISHVVVYQDDITIAGKNFQEHLATLKSVLNKLKSSGLTLNLKKCEFFKTKISYLGFTIDKTGLTKNNDRVTSVSKSPPPTDIRELRAFIGMANYYSKFISNFAHKMAPFYMVEKLPNCV